MALLTKSEFAHECRVHASYISTNISRKNIILSGDFIDTKIPANRDFLERISTQNKHKCDRCYKDHEGDCAPEDIKIKRPPGRPARNSAYKRPPIPRKPAAPKPVKQKKIKKVAEKKAKEPIYSDPVFEYDEVPEYKSDDFNPDKGAMSENLIKIAKAKADLDKKLVDVRIAKLTESKLRGDNIPTKMVRDMISALSKSFISSYKDAADRFLIEISHRKRLSSDESAEMKGELVKIINMAHDRSIDAAKIEMKAIVSASTKVSTPNSNEDLDDE